MATPNNKNLIDRKQASYREDPKDSKLTEVAVTDCATQTKLDAVIAALGGSSNTTTTIFNLSVPTAATEVSQVMPANTKRFKIRNRNKSRIQLAFTSGQSGTNYITIPPGATYENENFYTALTIYLQCYKASQIIEIEAQA